MNKLRILIGIFLVFVSYNSLACREVQWDISEWTENAESVYVVRIVGISVPELLEIPYSVDTTREALSISSMSKEVSLVVYETLKGLPQERASVTLNWCGGGDVVLGYIGVLYGQAKEWHIELGSESVLATKKALTNVSN